MQAHCPSHLQFGLNVPLSAMLLLGILLAGWVNGGWLGLALAGGAIFALAMAKKAGLVGSFLWVPSGTLVEWMVIFAIYLMLVGRLIPAVQTNCRSRRLALPAATVVPLAGGTSTNDPSPDGVTPDDARGEAAAKEEQLP